MEEDLPLGSTFSTDITMGERYRDVHTGFEGVATSITFYEFGCERIVLEGPSKDGKIELQSFDAPRLKHVDTGHIATTKKTGGPGHIAADRKVASR